jgi:hypothetical protein
VPEFVKDKGYTWNFVYDGNGQKIYNASALPVVLFIDRDGNLVERFDGAPKAADWDAALAKIL